MINIQLIANTPAMINLPPTLFVGSIEQVTLDEFEQEFVAVYNKLEFEQSRFITRDGYGMYVFYDDWSGWRIIVTDVII